MAGMLEMAHSDSGLLQQVTGNSLKSLISLVMEKFSSEPWFKPEPSRTEPEVQF